jgi:hypothetical protein
MLIQLNFFLSIRVLILGSHLSGQDIFDLSWNCPVHKSPPLYTIPTQLNSPQPWMQAQGRHAAPRLNCSHLHLQWQHNSSETRLPTYWEKDLGIGVSPFGLHVSFTADTLTAGRCNAHCRHSSYRIPVTSQILLQWELSIYQALGGISGSHGGENEEDCLLGYAPRSVVQIMESPWWWSQ